MFNLSWIREPKIIKFVKNSIEHFKYHELNYNYKEQKIMLNLLWIWELKMSNMSRIAYSIYHFKYYELNYHE